MASPAPTQFVITEVPSRIADLGFVYMRPQDFRPMDLPEEEPKFESPEYFIPLHVCIAPYGAVVFSVAARPAYDDGTVEDWLRFHAKNQLGDVLSIRPEMIGDLRAMAADAVQPSEAGTMHVRAYFVEEGKRLLIVSVMAPEQLWGSVETMLQTMISSFRLQTPKGQSVPTQRGAVTTPEQTPRELTPEERAELERPTEPAEVALASDAGSLAEDHPMNARLRDNGVGLVPRVLEVNEEKKYAKLGAGAIEAIFKVPLGWHVIDDGKRTLVFDAAGKVQVNLDLRYATGTPAAMLDSLLQEHVAQQPDIEHLRLELCGMQCLALRNYRVEDEVLEQAFLLKEARREGMVLVTRVTASSEDMVRAMNVAEVVLRDMETGA
jgi:hypothetical protein